MKRLLQLLKRALSRDAVAKPTLIEDPCEFFGAPDVVPAERPDELFRRLGAI